MDISLFHPLECLFDSSTMQLNDPFDYHPHPLVVEASRRVDELLCGLPEQMVQDMERGKMLGVLVVRIVSGEIGFLAAFSGMVAGESLIEGFVPPIYDLNSSASYFREEEVAISSLTAELRALESDEQMLKRQSDFEILRSQLQQQIVERRASAAHSKRLRSERRGAISDPQELSLLERESQHERGELRRFEQQCREQLSIASEALERWQNQIKEFKERRSELSQNLQRKMFESYRVVNGRGEWRSLYQIFFDLYGALPPAAAGDCAAPKLFQYALCHDLTPLAVGEFWHGAPPKGELRRDGEFYGACRGRCYPILNFVLQGIELMASTATAPLSEGLRVLYDDEHLVVVDKPAGMLSVAGRSVGCSVESEVRRLYPAASGAMMVHRLDQDTSGVMVVAKSGVVHKALQEQFARRTMRKRYVAIVDGVVESPEGEIRLPLSPNFADRPRQMVDYVSGKSAHTTFELLSVDRGEGRSRLALWPHTGRTHQLRVHLAHIDGLSAPIVGDRLYGRVGDRLLLHSESLEFDHPVSGERLEVSSPAPF